MSRSTRNQIVCCAFTVTLGIGAFAHAGDLTPPPGPVVPTMQTLDDVEPRRIIRNSEDGVTPIVISQPGSYKLGENIQALGLEHGIEVTASRVTIDLNGFEIFGSEIGSLDGINVAPGANEITIRNGRIRLFTGAGIDAANSARCRVENVDVLSTFSGGIICGERAFVDSCTAQSVTVMFGVGIGVGNRSKVTDCAAELCYTGFFAGAGTQITGCNASRSTFAGFSIVGNTRPTDCVATGTFSTQYGIYQDGSGGGEIADNVISNFSVAGIRATGQFQIHHNTIVGAGIGGDTGMVIEGPRNYIFENSIADCSTGLNLNNFCEQEVYSNRLANVGPLAINNCADIAPEASAHLSTNPYANLR